MSSRIRPKAWLSHHRPGTGSFKYHFNVHVHDVVLREGMVVPEGAKFRLVWKRGDKVASSREIAQASPMVFDESLSLVCTMYRDPAVGAYAEKEAAFALHMTGPRAGSATRQLARATLDLSKWAGIEAISEELKLVLLHDGVPVGDVRLTPTLTLTTPTPTLTTLTLTLTTLTLTLTTLTLTLTTPTLSRSASRSPPGGSRASLAWAARPTTRSSAVARPNAN